MARPFDLTEVIACDSQGLNEYRAWVNVANIVAVKDWNAGDGKQIMEVLTVDGSGFYIKDPLLVERRRREQQTPVVEPAN